VTAFLQNRLLGAVKAILPRQIRRPIGRVRQRMQARADRIAAYKKSTTLLCDATLANVGDNTRAFAIRHGLLMSRYFETLGEWKQNAAVANRHKDIGMSLQHSAMVDYLQRNPVGADSVYLDACCGMGNLFIYLNKLLGYTHFVGVDSDAFQPHVTTACRELLQHYGVAATIHSWNSVCFPSDYAGQYANKIDVFSHFVVDTFYFFPIANIVLKRGGLYIAELEDPHPGIYQDIFEVTGIYEGYGRPRESGAHPYHVVVMRKK